MPLPANLHPWACEYCSPEHKASDREKHEEACAAVKTAREETAMDELPSYFETDAGRFGLIDETRRYLLSRFRHADLLLYYFGSTDGEYTVTARVDILETVLAELLDMLRLSRADDLGAGIAIPSIYLALGRDQEAYDFIKWNTIADIIWDPDGWNDLDRPYLDLRGEDVLEERMGVWVSRSDQMLTFVVAVMLIKLRAIIDLLAMQNAWRFLAGVLPNEIIDIICWYLAGPVLSSRPDILKKDTEETADLIHTLKHQTLELYLSVAKSNTPFWDLMLDDDPETVKANEQRALEPSSSVEADLLARYNFTPWLLNPAALGAVRAWREWNSGEA